jgi:hypothetical protein
MLRSLSRSLNIFPKILVQRSLRFSSSALPSSYLCSIDQGTSSTRFIIFDYHGNIIGSSQKEHTQYYPERGHVEHDPEQIWKNTIDVVKETLASTKIHPSSLRGLGITNQRETTVVWNRFGLSPSLFLYLFVSISLSLSLSLSDFLCPEATQESLITMH